MVESKKPTVLITGVTGFVGSQILNEFLCGEGAGRYTIRATVRDKSNVVKMKVLKDYFGTKYQEIEFVNVDVNKPEQVDLAVKGCDFVVHSASPVAMVSPKDHDEIIRPAVNGNKHVIEAAQKHQVKRVVITSSVAAISHGQKKTEYDETCWSDLVACKDSAYVKSKVLSEKFLWDY